MSIYECFLSLKCQPGSGENMNCAEIPCPNDGNDKSFSWLVMNSVTFTPEEGTSSCKDIPFNTDTFSFVNIHTNRSFGSECTFKKKVKPGQKKYFRLQIYSKLSLVKFGAICMQLQKIIFWVKNNGGLNTLRLKLSTNFKRPLFRSWPEYQT